MKNRKTDTFIIQRKLDILFAFNCFIYQCWTGRCGKFQNSMSQLKVSQLGFAFGSERGHRIANVLYLSVWYRTLCSTQFLRFIRCPIGFLIELNGGRGSKGIWEMLNFSYGAISFFGTKSLEMIVLFGPNNSRLAIWTHSFVIQKILSLRVLKLRVLCGDRWKLILVRAPDIFKKYPAPICAGKLGWARSHFNDIRLWWFVNFTASKWWLMTSDYKLSAMQASRRGWWKLSSSIRRSPR